MFTSRGSMVAVLLVFTALYTAPSPGVAAPSEKALATVKKAFDKTVKVQFLQVPLERALEFLEKESGLTFIVDRASLSRVLAAPVELSVDSISIREALELALQQVREVSDGDIDYDIRSGRVLVTSRAKAIRPYLTTRVFDIRSLVKRRVAFDQAPRVGLNQLAPNGGGGGGSDLFEEEDGERLTTSESAQLLLELIRLSVRTGDHNGNWDIAGVSAREHNGLLLVVNTPQALDAVADLLDKYQQAQGKMISVNARFMLIPISTLEKFVKETTKGSLVLDADQVQSLLKLAQVDGKSKIIGTIRTVCFNDQRVYVTAGNERVFLSDLDPQVGTDASAFDPVMSTLINSTVLDIEPTASFDNKSVSMVIRGDIALGERMATRNNVVAMSTRGEKRAAKAEVESEEQEEDPADRKEGGSEVDIVPGGIDGSTATIDVPDQDSARFRTSAKIPSGGGVLLSAYSGQFKTFVPDGHEIVLLIQANVRP